MVPGLGCVWDWDVSKCNGGCSTKLPENDLCNCVGVAGKTGQYQGCVLRDTGRVWNITLPMWCRFALDKKGKEKEKDKEKDKEEVACIWAAIFGEEGPGAGTKRRPVQGASNLYAVQSFFISYISGF